METSKQSQAIEECIASLQKVKSLIETIGDYQSSGCESADLSRKAEGVLRRVMCDIAAVADELSCQPVS